ncbi:hypothetical protein ADL03_27180 [Nocardia sp. NRRL S-836]|nr:hypothetical protein ADL03_27180 [Nocardia sp. NRRL S-836]
MEPGRGRPRTARVALRYALQHAPDSIVLVSFRNPGQIRTDITCLGDPLIDDEITEIRTLLHPDINTEGRP